MLKRLKTLKVKTSYLENATLDLALFIPFHYYMSCILSAKTCSVRMAPTKTSSQSPWSRGYVSLSKAQWLYSTTIWVEIWL